MKSPLIFIVGPTAVGKTEISIRLAQRINAEIVSMDSRQIFRQMDIGTAKPTSEQQHAVPHHLIDCTDVDRPFTAADYQRRADAAIEDICRRKKRPLIVGGAGLYFRVLVDGLFEGPGANGDIRSRLFRELEDQGAAALHNRLRSCDPEAANRIHPNNLVKVIRALEIHELTGKPISSFQQQWTRSDSRYPFRAFGLCVPRDCLYRRVETRVNQMIESGLIEEVKGLLDGGCPRNCVAMQGIGYKEIVGYLDGQQSLDEAIALLKTNTRRFAKRQLTWFRNDPRIQWVELTQYESVHQAVDNLLSQSDVRALKA
ncbi:MAG: tRNA (adenosine(37)-N6)-dimethylallyltransferase MiaA [Candidatus Poribacteria bacterium]|nr:tRNA (adenosine(37)-N6)-dimethylallyltransferase MiaA [Candidatus Poribacteria bacterium]